MSNPNNVSNNNHDENPNNRIPLNIMPPGDPVDDPPPDASVANSNVAVNDSGDTLVDRGTACRESAEAGEEINLHVIYDLLQEKQTDGCKGLRDEVARLLKNGHLREFLSERTNSHFKNTEKSKKTEPEEPQHVINMIIGGVEIPRGPTMKKTKFSITQEKRTRDYVPDEFISCSDEDVEGIIQPQNDALVISVLINKTHVKCILIDPCSSVNIIQWKVVEQLGLLDQIVPAARVLNGFNMACETTKGEITLPVNAAGVFQHTKFYVIDEEMRYNALLGRPWLHIMRAVLSTLHQMLKFPTLEGVKIIHGEKPAAK
ncbi:uncharacterized protein LOC132613135 [Lycium barbarum]|uniref:uncharacterized protein LOC132613135 n=1 Tax=Lycium barbarum TaxID=112863 RepID=UPI00293EEF00|nr:uncharacterized protein LOC132613135 [Lycium barbarum]